MRKILYFIPLLVLAVVVALVLSFKKEKTVVISQKRNHSVTVAENEAGYISVPLLVSNKKSYFTDANQLITSSLSSPDGTHLPLELQTIDLIKTGITYQKKKYCNYNFTFKIDFAGSQLKWYLQDAYLNLKYNEKALKIAIGSLSYIILPEVENKLFTFSHIKPLTSNYQGNTYLAGIVFGIRSLSDTAFKLKQAEILNCDISLGRSVILLDNVPDTNSFKEITGYDFDNDTKIDPECDITVFPGTTVYLLIPLHYHQLRIVQSFPIAWHVREGDMDKVYYLDDYCYYGINKEEISGKDLVVYNLNDRN